MIGGRTDMNETELAHYRNRLQARLVELAEESSRGDAGQKTVELDQQAVGRLSRMDALQNQAMAKAQAARRDGEVRRIRAALERIDEGEFGYCSDCGDEIGTARLSVDPTLPRCLSCTRG